ncbi:flavodoxin domain-containing protein [Subtercola sp. PAMC28395]|nr:flavodoxin domain-containing protein [Subtercola sp. PAMC28395]
MRALVVYESLWGNTEQVARAIASELESTMSVELVDSDSAPPTVDGYDLLVVGGPTHAFSMTREATRDGAVKQNGAPRAPKQGIREWIAQLPADEPHPSDSHTSDSHTSDSHTSESHPSERHLPAITFDTRVDAPRLPGSAAKGARHELRSLGFDVRIKPRSFHVHGYGGPLVSGELAKAAAWAREFTVELSLPV